jgi:tetratricopeptide (TPR) repeat protein
MPLPIDKLERLTEMDPEDPTLRFALGQAYLDAGRFADAAGALERAVALNPLYTAAYWPLGKALEGAGRLTEALATYERGIGVGETTKDVIPTQKMRARLKRLRKQHAGSGDEGVSGS